MQYNCVIIKNCSIVFVQTALRKLLGIKCAE